MATLTLAPFGLRVARNGQGSAPNYQTNTYWIKNGYTTAIGFGDPVIRLGSPNQGYIGIYANGGTHILGVFAGVLGYYDTNLQQYVSRPNYTGKETPPTGIDVQVLVIDDKTAVYEIQVGGSGSANPILAANMGNNADIVVSTPNSVGISQAYLDSANVATTATLPLRIVGPSFSFFPGYDPTQNTVASQPTNNYAEVMLNTSEVYSTTGI